jgi:hypothetical protein
MNFANHILAALFVLLMLSLTSCAVEIPQAIVFENPNMDGQHKHVFESIPDLTQTTDGRFWNDQISSIIVISGNWTFCADPIGAGDVSNRCVTLGPGVYPDVKKERIEDNTISQIRLEKS